MYNKKKFRLISNKCLDYSNAICKEFFYTDTNTNIFMMKTNDRNRVFSILLKTPLENDYGLSHIIEHGLLYGSKDENSKYGIFCNFDNNYFTNYSSAWTFPDRTMFTINSYIYNDYLKLIEKYLQVVFNPGFLSDDNIFYKYKDEVYNEMKGYFCKSNNISLYYSQKHLYNNVFYKYFHGGLPNSILNVTLEQLKEYYNKYYNLSNTYLFFYGDFNEDDVLNIVENISTSYYISKEKERILLTNSIQNNTCEKMFVEETVNEFNCNSSIFSVNNIYSTCLEYEKYIASNIIKIILNINKKKMYIINKNIDYMYYKDRLQPIFSFIFKTNTMENINDLYNTYTDYILNFCENILSKYEIVQGIEQFFIRQYESSDIFPVGLNYSLKVFKSWIYERNPYIFLDHLDLDALKEKYSRSYIVDFMKKNFLENNHCLVAKYNFNNDILVKMSTVNNKKKYENEINASIIKVNRSITDIKNATNKVKLLYKNLILDRDGDNKIYFYPNYSSDSVVINIYFSVENRDLNEISFISFICDIINLLIYDKEYMYHDKINIRYASFPNYLDHKVINTKIHLAIKTFMFQIDDVLNCINRINTYVENLTEDDIRIYLRRIYIKQKNFLYSNMKDIMIIRSLAHISKNGNVLDSKSGLEYFIWLSKLIKNDFKNINYIQTIFKNIFIKKDLEINIIANTRKYREIKEKLKKLELCTDILGNKLSLGDTINESSVKCKEAIILNNHLCNGVSKSYKLTASNVNYGKILRLSAILRMDYFKYTVKERYSAREVFSHFFINGDCAFYALDSSDIGSTIDCFNSVGNYILSIKEDDYVFKNSIINCLNTLYDYDDIKNGERIIFYRLSNIDINEYETIIENIYNLSKDDLLNVYEILYLNNHNLTVFNDEIWVNEHDKEFDNIIKI